MFFKAHSLNILFSVIFSLAATAMLYLLARSTGAGVTVSVLTAAIGFILYTELGLHCYLGTRITETSHTLVGIRVLIRTILAHRVDLQGGACFLAMVGLLLTLQPPLTLSVIAYAAVGTVVVAILGRAIVRTIPRN
jgi:hypothetical protein